MSVVAVVTTYNRQELVRQCLDGIPQLPWSIMPRAIAQRMTFAIAWGTSFVLVPLLRALALSAVGRWQWGGEPAVLIGSRR
jgi:hypothetical protein